MKRFKFYIDVGVLKMLEPYLSYKDFKTSRHIVVFESDDWGSIRMSSKKDWEDVLQLGYKVDKRPYERFDTLESPDDIVALFEILKKYRDCNGKHPVVTANMLMANPDFDKIEQSGFENYHFEPVSNTYKRYFGDAKALDVMRQGLAEGLFVPQCHGREHFNVPQWLRALQNRDEDTMVAFRRKMCGLAPKDNPFRGNKFMAALKAANARDQQQINDIIKEGLQMFRDLWGFMSRSFVAPCYTWNEDIEKVLFENGVELIQTSRTKKAAFKSRVKHYYTGQQNEYNQKYSIRNCEFEPSTMNSSAEQTFSQIKKAFCADKIAIVSTHRINYVSGLDEDNRKKNLNELDTLLKMLVEQYDDIEFFSSDQLVDLLSMK